jgi:hypothetical protein
VPAECRHYVVPPAPRAFALPPESRHYSAPRGARAYVVPPTPRLIALTA